MATPTPTPTPTRTPSRTPSSSSSSSSSRPPALSPADGAKAALIRAACRDGEVTALASLATAPAGLLTDELRRLAWPLLLASSDSRPPALPPWATLPAHRDEHQVGLDVHRAFVYYPPHDSDKQLQRRKDQLSNVILDVLRRHPALCYFQGYHDIVQVFLLVLGPQHAPAAVARLSLLRIRDFMLSSLDPAIAQLELLRPILRAADPLLYSHLPQSQPSFALAGTITMFAHNIQNYADITRLFDFFLAGHAAAPIYLFAAVVLSRRDELLDIDKEDQDILYVMLGRLPEPFRVEFHIARTIELFERLPPASLRSWEWWRISSSSVLKASATNEALRHLTLEDGETLFAKQEQELRRQHVWRDAVKKIKRANRQIWYYRRYGYVGLAVLVGAYAVWLGRNGGFSSPRLSLFGLLGNALAKLAGRPH